MADFIVRLDIELPKEVEHRIAGAVQAAVMSELGKIDLRDKSQLGQIAFIPRKEWYGKWLRLAKDVKDLQALEHTVLAVSEKQVRG